MPPDAHDSANEVLAVVDAADRVIGCATRAEIHAAGLRHRAVHILVLNPAGEIYVQRRAADKDCDPGLWDTSAAGHVDYGESYDAAAPRELAEELGLVADLQPLWALPATPQTGHEFVQVYVCTSTRQPRPDAVEIAEGGWFTREQLDAWITDRPRDFTLVFRHIYARYAARQATPA